jgi:eukaryotic-like serine/threonine-protein kinase
MRDRIQAEEIIDGRYRVRHRIGSGGMADVYCAEDLQLGREVALKILHPRFAEDREFVERFRREASSAAGLQHPNVVSVYDRGEVDGTSYIAMEHVRGRTLKELAVEHAPMAPEHAIPLVVQVLRAARFAHRRGIIHRDLKPHNVMVDEEGRAKVTDFGIARAGASDMTQTGSIMGTAQYLSPEQAQGHAVSARSDLYAIGIILYELLTGRVPFDGDSPVTIALKQVNEPPVPPSAFNRAVTPELDAAVLRALAKDPADRYADADEFIAVLEAIAGRLPHGVPVGVAGDGVGTGPVAVAYDPVADAEQRERRGWIWWVLLGLLAAAVVIGALLLFGGGREVQVPNVVGATESVAEQRLRQAGFVTDSVNRRSERPEGQVIATDPPPGSRADEGSTVRLTVSSGPGEVTVPAVEGLPRSEALQALEDAGLRAREETRASEDVSTNRVIEAVPGQGSSVQVGATVTLVLSSGPTRVAVPDVVGQTRTEAQSTLESDGFRVRIDEQESDEDPNTVTAQNPKAGTQSAEGSVVTITVAVEPAAPEQVEVPDVTGEPVASAVRTLSAAGFEVQQVERQIPTPDGDGTVIEQDPAGGTAEDGSTVRIVIARYEPPADDGSGDSGTEPAPQDDGSGGDPL